MWFAAAPRDTITVCSDARGHPNPAGGPEMIHVKKILYPTDFSTYSNLAYFHAVGLAETYGASLTVVYVYTPGSAETAGGDRKFWRSQLEQVRPGNPGIPVHHVFLEGDPAGEIVRYAADAGIDVIVLGTHGRRGISRLLMGSVAELILRGAACPVITVKAPLKPAKAAAPEMAREVAAAH